MHVLATHLTRLWLISAADSHDRLLVQMSRLRMNPVWTSQVNILSDDSDFVRADFLPWLQVSQADCHHMVHFLLLVASAGTQPMLVDSSGHNWRQVSAPDQHKRPPDGCFLCYNWAQIRSFSYRCKVIVFTLWMHVLATHLTRLWPI